MAHSNEANSTLAREFVVTRTFDAPRELVWQAWTDLDHLDHWWGPKGFTMRLAKNELRPGGTFLYSMLVPGSGETWWGKWVYREIVPPERLVFVSSFSDPEGNVTRAPFFDDFPLEVLSTVTLTESGGRTTLTMRGVPLNASEAEQRRFAEMSESMQGGWGGTLDQLEEHLAVKRREIATTRVFDAPRELVWEAWTKPEHVEKWWGPNGFTTTTTEMDVRPDGMWRHVMHGPDGIDYPNEITYVEVVRPERLVYEHGPTPLFHVTVNFAEEGRKTRVDMQMLFQTAEERDHTVAKYGAIEGMHQTLDRLTGYLETMG